jgi:hypothetical protein
MVLSPCRWAIYIACPFPPVRRSGIPFTSAAVTHQSAAPRRRVSPASVAERSVSEVSKETYLHIHCSLLSIPGVTRCRCLELRPVRPVSPHTCRSEADTRGSLPGAAPVSPTHHDSGPNLWGSSYYHVCLRPLYFFLAFLLGYCFKLPPSPAPLGWHTYDDAPLHPVVCLQPFFVAHMSRNFVLTSPKSFR